MAKHRILVVDDEDDIRLVVAQVLSKKYEVVEAGDGLDALEKLQRVEPDFVVMDVMMPLMDGFKACEAIRRHPKFRETPVLFLSALNTRDKIKQGYASGASLFLTKPFDPIRLLRNVDVFFEKHDLPPREKALTIEQVASGSASISSDPPSRPPRPAIRRIDSPHGDQTAPFFSTDLEETPPETPPRGVSRDASLPSGRPPVRPRVLAVDDDPDLLSVVKMAISGEYEVVRACDGIDAVDKIVSAEPDIILIDGMMPRMTGYQLCQSLRRNARYRDTPILMMSAKSAPRDQAYAKRIGANDFIGKPFDLDALRDKLAHIQLIPGFHVRPKATPIAEIHAAEQRREDEKLAREREEKAAASKARGYQKPEGELEQFLKELS